MKLYTEEQVKDAFCKAFYTDNSAVPYSEELGIKQTTDSYMREFMKSLTPIELPSDEEIKYTSELNLVEPYASYWRTGCKWVIEQIKQQADGKNIN